MFIWSVIIMNFYSDQIFKTQIFDFLINPISVINRFGYLGQGPKYILEGVLYPIAE